MRGRKERDDVVKGRGEFWKNESGVVTVFLDQTDTNLLLFVDESRSILLDQPRTPHFASLRFLHLPAGNSAPHKNGSVRVHSREKSVPLEVRKTRQKIRAIQVGALLS